MISGVTDQVVAEWACRLGLLTRDQARQVLGHLQQARRAGMAVSFPDVAGRLGLMGPEGARRLAEAIAAASSGSDRYPRQDSGRQTMVVPPPSGPPGSSPPVHGAPISSRPSGAAGTAPKSQDPLLQTRVDGVSGSDQGPMKSGVLARLKSEIDAPDSGRRRYRVGEELARGGMGAILEARDRFLGRDVAMKVMLRADERQEARFFEEARLTGQLDHPNIVPVHDIGVDADGAHFFTMKLVRGRSLAELLSSDAELEPEDRTSLRRLLDIFMRVLDAVRFAHSHEVIHRDLKPANIMIGAYGEVYVMDWGLARYVGARGDNAPDSSGNVESLRHDTPGWTLDGAICGTPNYMPPEQAEGDPARLDERADVYALGAILYEMLTLRRAFDADDLQTLMSRVFSNSYEDPESAAETYCPPELSAVVRKSLALDREDRYGSVAELKDDIEAFLDGRAVSARRDPLLTRMRKWVGRHPAIAAGGSIGTLSLLGVLIVAFYMPATLRLDLSGAPEGAEVRINGRHEPVRRTPEESVVETSVWPPGLVTVEVISPGYRPWRERLVLASRGRESLAVRLEQRCGRLTVASPIGVLEVLLKREGEEEVQSLRAPFFERELPVGRYRAELRSPDYFSTTHELEIKEGELSRLSAELEPITVWSLSGQASVTDTELLDANSDGRMDLLICTEQAVEMVDLGRNRPLWRIPFVQAKERKFQRGDVASVGDVDGDGQLEVVLQDGARVMVLSAATGVEESRFPRFLSRLECMDTDGDSVSEIICATPYRGVQVFRADGSRKWVFSSPRYAAIGSRRPVQLKDRRHGLLITTGDPRRLIMLDLESGAPIWSRTLPRSSRNFDLDAAVDENGRSLIVARTGSGIVAFDADSGARTWQVERSAADIQLVTAVRFEDTGPLSILAHSHDQLICFDSKGREVWTLPLESVGPGSIGDVDGDGVREWIVPCSQDRLNNRFSYVIVSSTGRIVRELATVSRQEIYRGSMMPPVVADIYGDGRPVLLTCGEADVRLLKLAPEQGRRRTSGFRMSEAVVDLDGDGQSEVVAYHSLQVRVEGSINWSKSFAERYPDLALQGPLRVRRANFADMNHDGVKDLLLPLSEAAVVLDGKTGETLLERSVTRSVIGPLAGPEESGGRRAMIVGDSHDILVVDRVPGVATGAVRHKWQWPRADGVFIVLSEPEPSLVYASADRQVRCRSIVTGEIAWSFPSPEFVAYGGLREAEGRIFIAYSTGRIVCLDKAGKLIWDKRPLVDISVLKTRRGPEGIELVANGFDPVIVFMDPRTGKILRKVSIRDLREFGTLRLGLSDLDGDGVDDLLGTSQFGFCIILDGVRQERIYTSSRFTHNFQNDREWFGAPEAKDYDGDGRLDLLVHDMGASVMFNLPQLLARAGRGHSSHQPLIELAYLIRDVRNRKSRHLNERVRRLSTTRFATQARVVAASLDRRFAEQVGEALTLDQHLGALVGRLREGRPLGTERARTRRLFGPSLVGTWRRIVELRLTPAMQQALVAHVRASIKGERKRETELLRAAMIARIGLDRDGERRALEALVEFFPEGRRGRERFIEWTIQRAATLHLTFDRTEPMRILRAALKHCEDPRLHVLLGRIIAIRLQSETARALSHFDRAVELAGGLEAERGRAVAQGLLARALAYRAEFFIKHRQAQRGQADLAAARRADPNEGLVDAVEAMLLSSAGRHREALQLATRALRRGLSDPLQESEAMVRLVRVGSGASTGQFEAALEDLRRARLARGSGPGDPNQDLNLAVQLLRAGRADLAIPLLERVASSIKGSGLHQTILMLDAARDQARLSRRGPETAARLAAEARVALRRKDGRRAESLIERAVARAIDQDEKARMLSAFGRLRFWSGEPEAAVKPLRAALELVEDGDPRFVYDRLMLAAEKLGRSRSEGLAEIVREIGIGAGREHLERVGLTNLVENEKVRAALENRRRDLAPLEGHRR